jgi:hypothetical protein
VVIRNLDIGQAWRSRGPLEANAPLIIDANAILALAVATQRLEPAAGKRRQVFQAACGIQAIKPDFCLTRETGELLACSPWAKRSVCLFR